MSKYYLFLFLILICPFSATAYNEDPHHQFDMMHNDTNEFQVTFVQAANVNKACDAESRKRGQGGFGYAVEACSFWNWNKSECMIITERKANFHTIGHEIRHCLQGNWHDLKGEIKK